MFSLIVLRCSLRMHRVPGLKHVGEHTLPLVKELQASELICPPPPLQLQYWWFLPHCYRHNIILNTFCSGEEQGAVAEGNQ